VCLHVEQAELEHREQTHWSGPDNEGIGLDRLDVETFHLHRFLSGQTRAFRRVI
jgi:hypothetical protein